jgi:hypothetical protein
VKALSPAWLHIARNALRSAKDAELTAKNLAIVLEHGVLGGVPHIAQVHEHKVLWYQLLDDLGRNDPATQSMARYRLIIFLQDYIDQMERARA